MARWRIPAGVGLALLLLAAAGGAGLAVGSAAEPGPKRQAELLYRLKQDCGSCHGLTLKGGLGPPLLPESVADKPEESLIEAILDGVPGTPMPPWRFEIDRDEATWLVHRIREGRTDAP